MMMRCFNLIMTVSSLSSYLRLRRFPSCENLHWPILVEFIGVLISQRGCLYFLLKS
ncbi:hypothetical protein CK203_034439 [Vitis vinifera]|uniref:Uncharacterized protein n=1 Tax=Vitis vinifera TaxID=29760 RepID=A0A438HZF1_VITVI|nr:hypothetical protein CK203_034439 [Vitis vinifera]